MTVSYTRPPLVWSEPDGSIPHALAHAAGSRFVEYTIFDALGVDFGDARDVMAGCVTSTYRAFLAEFPDGHSRRYTTLAGAKAAVERHYR